MDWREVAIPIIVALIAASPGIYAIRSAKKKEEATTAESASKAAQAIVEMQSNKIEELRGVIALQVQEECDRMRERIRRLERQITDMGELPVNGE